MSAKRIFVGLLIGLAATFLAVLGAAYATVSLLQSKSAQLTATKAEVSQLSNQQTGLAQSKRDIARYASLEQITKSIVPQDKDQAQTVRELTNIATANKISLTTITFPSSSLGATAAVGPATTSAATAATKAKPNLSQLTPVVNIPGVYNLQITIGNNSNNSVTFTQLDSFLRSLENNRRTAAVSSISIQPRTDDPNQLVFTLIINTYIKPS